MAGRAVIVKPDAEPWRLAAWLAALVALIAAVQLLWAFGSASGAKSLLTLDDRLWPVGHTLQYVHVLLLMAAWSVLAEGQSVSRGLLPALMIVTALPALASLGATFLHPMGSVEQRVAFTTLMRWTSWPPAVVYGLVLLKGLLGRRAFWREPESAALLLSILLFFAGCLLGATIRGESTAVPAHYHGTVGAVTLAYLVWGQRLLSALGLPAADRPRLAWLPLIYGLGIALLVAGLGWWGGQDVPRKVAHAELLGQGVPYFLAMGLAGLGGLLALGAVLVHVGLLFRRLAQGPRVDVRPFALGLTLLLLVGGGWLLGGVDGNLYRGGSLAGHVAERKGAEIEARFQQGVIMLHARQYEHALAAFHRVLELAPEMPEAHVNIGYALLGMRKYAAARDFFDAATELRNDQINAYYGLAVALEGTGDVAGALGAMRTYLHRTASDDPYRRKAEAAVWEWEEKLRLQREKK
ncbi:hypothetical protein CBW56_05430 [Denitratisoma oestradiolicum]|nr:hypothetical protein CBW56_05430 [Denitratisoma oestradiolicum]